MYSRLFRSRRINEQTDFENVTNSVGYLASVKNFKFKRLVTAGDQLKIICELQSVATQSYKS